MTIRFTVEKEQKRYVPFLDTKVTIGEDKIIRLNWFVKPTCNTVTQ